MFVDLLARVLREGGVVRLATDWQHYAEQMLQVMTEHPEFVNVANEDSPLQSAFVARASHRPLTRFERRGHRLGHGVWDLAFRRKRIT
jgi:tRNA (guanine-N7-)-methyltransferase